MENHVFSLPSEIVEHIQSLMNAKEAARSAILSKYLYNSWSKRSNLDFDQRHFRYERERRFSEFTKKTMQRYEDSKLKIDTFSLRISFNSEYMPLAKELVVWAIKLGAVDIRLEFLYGFRDFVFPDEMFGSETLTRLSVTGGSIDLGSKIEVTRSKLKSLHLSPLSIIDGDLFSNLVLRCPSLEKLVCDGYLLSFDNRKLNYGFHKLESLSLDNLRNKDSLFFKEMLLRFPCLKLLAIRNIYNCGSIRICSQSLERISLMEYYRALTAEFDVPNLRKFHFEGSASSCLTFETTSRDWESDIHIICFQSSSSWLSSLRKLLQNLSMSKVFLSIHVEYDHSKYICDYTRSYDPIPIVDRLEIRDHAPSSGLVDGLFLICRPKLVYLQGVAPGKNELLQLLLKKLGCIPNPSMHDLEEVKVEVFEKRLSVWRPLPWNTLLDSDLEFRFRLRWTLENSAS